MHSIVKATFFFLVLYVFTSCAVTKKIDFESAYKFSRYNYHKADESDIYNQEINKSTVLASAEEVDINIFQEKLSTIEEKLYQKTGVSIENATSMNANELTMKFRKLTKQEKREMRNEIKKDLKNMKELMVKNSFDTNDFQQVKASTDYTRLVFLIGGVGLILLILGAIFSGFLLFVGALAVVAAAILFIIDQA